MSEVINKMNIDELRVYARSLEHVKADNLDVNYASERIIFQFSELVRSILDREEFMDHYNNSLNGFNEFENQMKHKYYPQNLATDSTAFVDLSAVSKEEARCQSV